MKFKLSSLSFRQLGIFSNIHRETAHFYPVN